MGTSQYTLSDVQFYAREVLRRALQLTYKLHSLRFRLAKEVLGRLQTYTSSPTVVEVNGYQTYIWLPTQHAREYRVWPYSLTAKPGGWLETRPYAPASPPMLVSWPRVFGGLKASFSVNTAVLQSIKDLLSMLTQASIQAESVYPEDYSGVAQYGAYMGWYRMAGDGIYVKYFDRAQDRWVEGRIATSETSGCDAKERLRTLLNQVLSGLQINCDGRYVAYPYEAAVCSDLDQAVTYIRQLLDKTVFCPYIFPDSILFVTGPLEGLTYTYQVGQVAIFYDGKIATVVNVSSVEATVNTAIANCAAKLKAQACGALAGP